MPARRPTSCSTEWAPSDVNTATTRFVVVLMCLRESFVNMCCCLLSAVGVSQSRRLRADRRAGPDGVKVATTETTLVDVFSGCHLARHNPAIASDESGPVAGSRRKQASPRGPSGRLALVAM